MIRLGVNVDHVATVRQARQTFEPDPVQAATVAELAGADSIVAHLREDRRHIQDADLKQLLKSVTTWLNLEMGLADEIVEIALRSNPRQVTLVPERREEVTTEGGLNVAGDEARIQAAIDRFHDAGIRVSLFIDPDEAQIAASHRVGAEAIELHTGIYANAEEDQRETPLQDLVTGSRQAAELGLEVAAGHGLTYFNVQPIAAIPEIEELNIGHSIVSRSIMVGFEQAVREMKQLMLAARTQHA